jgi:hypothetical protein
MNSGIQPSILYHMSRYFIYGIYYIALNIEHTRCYISFELPVHVTVHLKSYPPGINVCIHACTMYITCYVQYYSQ